MKSYNDTNVSRELIYVSILMKGLLRRAKKTYVNHYVAPNQYSTLSSSVKYKVLDVELACITPNNLEILLKVEGFSNYIRASDVHVQLQLGKGDN